MAAYRKRVIQETMAALEEETDQNNVKEGAHIRLSNLLQRAFNASEVSPNRHVEEYLTQQMITWPHTIEFLTPAASNRLARDPNFLTGVVIAKRATSATRTIDDRWWDDLMGGLLETSVLDLGDDYDSLRRDLYRLAEFCIRCPEAWNYLARRLDRMEAPQPYKLFPCGIAGSEIREADNDPDDEQGPDVWDMLTPLPRFVGWLLWPNDGCTIHGYNEEEKARLKEFAFFRGIGGFTAALGEAETRDCDDPGWLRVLGLRGWVDVCVCEKCCLQANMSFAQACEFVKDKTTSELAQVRTADLVSK